MLPAWIQRLLESEPALLINAVAALLVLAAAFGIHTDDAQIDALKTFIGNALILIAALAGTRQSVYAPDTHAEEVAKVSYEAMKQVQEEAGAGAP